MQTSNALVAVALALALGACDGTSSGSEAAQNAEEAINQPTVENVAGAEPGATPQEKVDEPQMAENVQFSVQLATLEDVLKAEVLGLSLGMSPDKVREVLLERGFSEPETRANPYAGTAAPPSTGIACNQTMFGGRSTCEIVGLIQMDKRVWERTTESGDKETVTPLFIVAQEGNQELQHLEYSRSYNPDIAPQTVAAQMKERFGDPTREAGDATYSKLEYFFQMEIPRGYKPSAQDDRSANEFTRQRWIEKSRSQCLNDEVVNFPTPRTEQCETILAGDTKMQRWYDALRLGKSSPNRFLEIRVRPDQLTILLEARFLSELQEQYEREIALEENLAELKRRSEAPAEVPSDL